MGRERLVASGESIADTIKQARLARGLSQHGLAQELIEASGNPLLARAHVARWERGEHIPGPYWLPWLSKMLEIPAGVLERPAWLRAKGSTPRGPFGPGARAGTGRR